VRFYVEAKKPSRTLRNPQDCFQAIRYGWNSNTPFAILTDFEETLLLDCRAKPDIASATSRVLQSWHYTDWNDEEKFKRFYYLFAREAVSQNSLETYLTSLSEVKSASGRQQRLFRSETQAVDVDFLKKLEEWRSHLASDFRAADKTLGATALTETTQRALDRLVFLRFLEDKGIELTERVSHWHGDDAWRHFAAASRELDKAYNGVLWKRHAVLDNPDFKPWGKTKSAWSDIVFEIASNQSPYLFNLIPIPILGSIYERFLGNEIEIGALGKVDVSLKPEARKAGGVYYTPDFIVSYIVENTIGPLLENKTPDEMAQLRLADIACGSGSFLLGIYDLLLRRHAAYYATHPKAAKNAGCENRDGAWVLSLKQRRQILENNIFGCDIDAQAVEVAKLSLYLKLLEDETAASAKQFQMEFDAQILPDLERNIVCGNALIGFDVLDGSTLSPEAERKLNPMDWKTTFPQIFRQGGFDAIVGNPPYGAELTAVARKYSAEKWQLATTDTAALMMVQARSLLKDGGRNGFIIPKPFIYASNWQRTRDEMLPDITLMADVGKVWKNVKLEQVIYLFQKGASTPNYQATIRHGEDFIDLGSVNKVLCEGFGFIVNGLSPTEISIGTKIKNAGASLGEFISNSRGAMLQSQVQDGGKGRRVIGGAQVQREGLIGSKGMIPKKSTLPAHAFVKTGNILAQNIVAHIQNPTDHIKITACVVSPEDSDVVILDTVNQLDNHSTLSSEYLCALLSSKLINWFVYRFIFAKAIRTMHFDAPVSNRIPIVDTANSPTLTKLHDQISKQFQTRQLARAELADAKTDTERSYSERKVLTLDRQIDELVYELYALSPDEIEIVEQASPAEPSTPVAKTASLF
jgi:type I restriction-modification system DNA methylase subunit